MESSMCSSVWTPSFSSGEVETLLWDPIKYLSLPEPLSTCKQQSQEHNQPEKPHSTHLQQPREGAFPEPPPRAPSIARLQSLSMQAQGGLQGLLRALHNSVWF